MIAGRLIGSVVAGRYRVDALVGEGGHATVLRAHHLRLDSPVALKVLRLPLGLSSAQRAELLSCLSDESKLLSRLRHESIVRVLDVGELESEHEEERLPYLVTELCTEGTLAELLERSRGEGVPMARAWGWMRSLLDGLAHAHRAGVVHRDLKPQNLMLARDEQGRTRLCLIDFGLAKLWDASKPAGSLATASRTSSASTPAYAAPEQVLGARTGPWTDVHAAALIFVELLTGRSPYPLEPITATLQAAISPDRPTPKVFGADAGPFEAVLARALSLQPSDRYADAEQLLEACVEAAKSLPSRSAAPSTSPPARPELITPAARRRPGRWLAAPLLLLPLALALWWGLKLSPRAHLERPEPALFFAHKPRALGSLSLEELWERADRHGFYSPRTTATSVEGQLSVPFQSRGRPGHLMLYDSLDAARVSARSFVSAGFDVVYGVSGRSVLSIAVDKRAAPPARTTFVLFAHDVTFDELGDSMGGPDPLGVAPP